MTGWLRWSASQPEPLIGKCDEDVLVVPPMLEAYATLLCNMSLHAGQAMLGGREPAQVLAGVFEWYSWAPATLAAKVITAVVGWAGRSYQRGLACSDARIRSFG